MTLLPIFLVVGLWVSAQLIHQFFLARWGESRVRQWLQQHLELSVSLWKIEWETTKLNRWISNIAFLNKKRTKIWYDAGVVVGIMMMIVILPLLMYDLYLQLFPAINARPILTVMVPGVNIPFSTATALFCAIVVNGIIHEIGHAIAAAREGVKLQKFGVFSMAVFYVGAFCDFKREDLERSSRRARLRIYCAGAWHNFVLFLFFIFIGLFVIPHLVAPLLFTPTPSGLDVVSVDPESPLAGHVQEGQTIVELNECSVNSLEEWGLCLLSISSPPQHGFCIDLVVVSDLASKDYDCCDPSQSDLSSSFRCFVDKDLSTSSCLAAKSVYNNGLGKCYSSSDCSQSAGVMSCVAPKYADTSQVLRIKLSDGKSILLEGEPLALTHYVFVSSLRPNYDWISLTALTWISSSLDICAMLSAGLCFINMIPTMAMDGQLVLCVLLEYLMDKKGYSKKSLNSIAWWVHYITLGVLALDLFASFTNVLSNRL